MERVNRVKLLGQVAAQEGELTKSEVKALRTYLGTMTEAELSSPLLVIINRILLHLEATTR